MLTVTERIAKLSGFSPATVSRVLNNVGPVSETTRRAILEAVAASGTVPKLRGPRKNAKAKAGNGSPRPQGLIDVVMVRQGPVEWELRKDDGRVTTVPASKPAPRDYFSPQNRYASSYFRALGESVIEEVQRCGYRAVMQITNQLPGRLQPDGGSAGMILLGNQIPEVADFIDSQSFPIVSLIAAPRPYKADFVGIDNVAGIAEAFDHLYGLGHRKIGFISGSRVTRRNVFYERYLAYRMKLSEAGLAVREDWMFFGSCNFPEDQVACEAILRQPDRPTALICGYDGIALAAKMAADAVGLRVPDDLSITGFDDQELAGLSNPPLTTLRTPTQEMGRYAVQLLMMRLRGTGVASEHTGIRFTPRLIVRQTTAAPPAVG